MVNPIQEAIFLMVNPGSDILELFGGMLDVKTLSM